MILYMTSKKCMNILDFLNETEEVLLRKYVGDYYLKDFLGKSIQRLGHVETIVIDRTCLSDTDEEIIEAVKTFKSFSRVKIVFYIDNSDQSLVHELIGLGVFNIITESEVDKLREEIKICLFEGMTERYIKNKVGLIWDEEKEMPFDFKGKQITIGVVGSQHRVGTTTVAMQFACYLSSIGAKVSYVEANDSGHMRLIAEYYGMDRNREGYSFNGIIFEYMKSKNECIFDFIIYDLGVLNDKVLRGYKNCQLRILCAGIKPHEKLYFDNSIEILGHLSYVLFTKETCQWNDCELIIKTTSNQDKILKENIKVLEKIIRDYLI